ncbi:hypothetical protein OSC52_18690 [Clostridium pasteurianum]|uniref:hypothetical protein n=1 Tax=Clostridium pasteurianum TaxID=1501 RepID=UPI002260B44B|nr:hypothetical protein [Clostridium pasteurianum]UZW13834.1 hypothetical protein OSC52_18690 [Clostridium pasteurianum]
MNQFIKVNNKILNKNNITQVVMDPNYTVEEGVLSSKITIFYVQGKEILEKGIRISIQTGLETCAKAKGNTCGFTYYDEDCPDDLCGQCEYIEDASKLAENICKEKLAKQFDVIAGALGVDDIPEINCNGYISLGEEGKLCWKER